MTEDLKTPPTDAELPNRAPRVTPADIEAEIEREDYINAGAATRSVGGPLNLLTVCVLTLRNGFTVTGEGACASPENFDAEIGKRIARQAAVAKVWPLLGFRMRDRLAAGDERAKVVEFLKGWEPDEPKAREQMADALLGAFAVTPKF